MSYALDVNVLLAALLVQHGVTTLYSRDTDFHKFREIQVRDPFS